MAEEKVKELLKKKKKKWYNILSSKEFNNSIVGQTLASDPKSLVGRVIGVNLANLTRDVKHQNTKIIFSITDVKENQANTEIVAYELIPAFIKRIIRVSKSKIDLSIQLKTKDGIKARAKVILLTRSKTKRSILTAIRKKITEVLESTAEKNDYTEIISQLIAYKIQKDLKNQLKKIYPLSTSEIRLFKKVK